MPRVVFPKRRPHAATLKRRAAWRICRWPGWSAGSSIRCRTVGISNVDDFNDMPLSIPTGMFEPLGIALVFTQRAEREGNCPRLTTQDCPAEAHFRQVNELPPLFPQRLVDSFPALRITPERHRRDAEDFCRAGSRDTFFDGREHFIERMTGFPLESCPLDIWFCWLRRIRRGLLRRRIWRGSRFRMCMLVR